MSGPLSRRASRRDHLDQGNLLRSLTEVIDAVPGGINLGQGVCDLDPPAPLVQGAVESIQGADRQLYTPYRGLPGLREVLAEKLRNFNQLEVGPDEVCVSLGSSGAFFAALLTLTEPGDEVLLFEPFYSYHWSVLTLCGLRPVCLPMVGDELEIDFDALRAAIGPKTKGIVLNTPANPSGRILSREELAAIGSLLDGTDIAVFTDEVYEYMCFDGREHVSPATVASLRDRTLTMGSFSKTYSVTGWRVGYVAGPADTVDAIGRVCDQIHVCAPRPMQRGVERALRDLPQSFYTDLQNDYERRRNAFCDALDAGGFKALRPQGAYYVLADYRDVLGDVEPYPAVLDMIERLGINGVPGHLFHAVQQDVRTIRFHFAVEDRVLEEACRRLRAGTRS